LANAKSLEDVRKDGYSDIFTSIFQAYLPDPDNPPLFIDMPAHKVGGQLIIDTQLTQRLRENFFLESMISQNADNLKSLRGFKFDWGRSDLNQDHVYSNQAFTHKLNEFGIPHEAEEYKRRLGETRPGATTAVSIMTCCRSSKNTFCSTKGSSETPTHLPKLLRASQQTGHCVVPSGLLRCGTTGACVSRPSTPQGIRTVP
jgi:hypothetical protein